MSATRIGQAYQKSSGGGGGITKFARAATFVIAASNSLDTTDADYICTGSNDQTTINTAIAALPSGTGRILFLEGLYNLSGSINCGGGGGTSSVVLQGQGWNTQFKLANSTNTYMFDFGLSNAPQFTMGLTMRDMYLNCNGANQSSAGGGVYARGAVWCIFDHVFFEAPWEAGIRFFQDGAGNYGHHNVMLGCLFRDGKNSNGGNGWAIKFEQADENRCIGCTFQDNGTSSSYGVAQIYDTSAGLQSIVGCSFVGGGNGAPMFFSDSGPGRCAFIGNQFDGPNGGADCLRINGGGHMVVGNTFINVGGSVSGPWAGVHIGNTTGNSIIGNSFYSSNSNAVGVTEDAGAVGNVIQNNFFTGTWTSGPIVTAAGSTSFVANNSGFNSTLVVSSNTTITSATPYILGSGSTTITLPTAVGCAGYQYTIKKTDSSNTLTIATTSSQTIDGSTTATISVQYLSLTLMSDGSNWNIV